MLSGKQNPSEYWIDQLISVGLAHSFLRLLICICAPFDRYIFAVNGRCASYVPGGIGGMILESCVASARALK